jgi:hypothetical protein
MSGFLGSMVASVLRTLVNSPQLPSTHHQLWKTLDSDWSQAVSSSLLPSGALFRERKRTVRREEDQCLAPIVAMGGFTTIMVPEGSVGLLVIFTTLPERTIKDMKEIHSGR